MRVTTWTEYSLIIALHLARRGGERPVAARDISESERLPGEYVEQILLRLRRAGLVESVRGSRGGYLLARSPESISVHDVMAACAHQVFEINCDTHQVDDIWTETSTRRFRKSSRRSRSPCGAFPKTWTRPLSPNAIPRTGQSCGLF